MPALIVAFPRQEDARGMKQLLVQCGYGVDAVCTNGAQVIGTANELDGGVVICGYRLKDMLYYELNNYLPVGYEMLLMASAGKLEDCINNNIMCLALPVKKYDLLNTLEMMTYRYDRWRRKKESLPGQRSREERELIEKAKRVLMSRNHISEEEAHRYIQKTSMDRGIAMVKTARLILGADYKEQK